MKLNEAVEIEVEHSGLLEVPTGKEVDKLPQSHFQKLIDKKGYEAIIRGLTNLEVWNKNKNPKLSQWASNMADKLKVANKKDESHSQNNKSYTIHNIESLEKAEEIIRRKLNPKNLRIVKTHGLFYDGDRNIAQYGKGSRQLVIFESYSTKLYEVNAKLAKKLGTKTVAGLKKVGQYAKDTVSKSADTARNAIVAGAVAPVGAAIAQKYNYKDKKKEPRYTAAEVAALAAAMKKTESLSNRLVNHLAILEKEDKEESGINKVAKGAAKGAGVGLAAGSALGATAGHAVGKALTGGLKGKVAGGLVGAAAKGVRALTTAGGAGVGGALGLTRGAAGGAIVAGGKHLYDKHQANKETSKKNESLIEALDRLKSIYEEEGLPKKKRILTPEQKARRQERRKLRRQLEKQGVLQKKPKSGPVKTIQGEPNLASSINNVKNAQKTAQTASNTQKTAQAVEKTVADSAKKMGQTIKGVNKTNRPFRHSQALKKVLNKAAFKGGLKGAAITAGLGAAGLAAKKAYDKNKKK